MARIDWKNLLEHEGDEILTALKKAEEAVLRAIRGIWMFLVTQIPELLRHIRDWVQEKLLYAGKVATRVGRLAGLALAWLLIVGGPLAIYPGIITGAWGVLALVGSYWGLQRRMVKQQRITITEVKGVRHGR